MLPFPKRKANAATEEVELDDDDLVLVDDAAPLARSAPAPARRASSPGSSGSSSRSGVRAAAARPYASALPPGSRRVLDEQIEEDVAGQCLASIAAATSSEHVTHQRSSSHIRAALASADVPSPRTAPPESRGQRLPSVSAPPFLRTTTTTYSVPIAAARRDDARLAGAPEAPGIRESQPPPAAFVRRSTPAVAFPFPSSSAMLPAAAPSQATHVSVAPVSMPSVAPVAQEPTVILVRERPRSIWILGAAAVGALVAVAAMRFVPVSLERPAVEPSAAAAQPQAASTALPSTAVTAPVAASAAAPISLPLVVPLPAAASAALTAPAVAAAPSSSPPSSSPPSSPGAVMHFAEDQGVAISVPAAPAAAPRKTITQPAASPAPRPAAVAPARAPSMGAALPDGSFGLGRSDTTTAAAPPPPTPAAPPPEPPPPPRKRVLTPEQQLAEAQLKASMK